MSPTKTDTPRAAVDLVDAIDAAIDKAREVADANAASDTFWGPRIVETLQAARADAVNLVHRSPGDMDEEALAALEPEPIAGDRPPEAGVIDEHTGEAVSPEELEARQAARKSAKAKGQSAED